MPQPLEGHVLELTEEDEEAIWILVKLRPATATERKRKQLWNPQVSKYYLSTMISVAQRTKKKPTTALPAHSQTQISTLVSWFDAHNDTAQGPYPKESQKRLLCYETGLNLRQINDWFSNRRRRHWDHRARRQHLRLKATTRK